MNVEWSVAWEREWYNPIGFLRDYRSIHLGEGIGGTPPQNFLSPKMLIFTYFTKIRPHIGLQIFEGWYPLPYLDTFSRSLPWLVKSFRQDIVRVCAVKTKPCLAVTNWICLWYHFIRAYMSCGVVQIRDLEYDGQSSQILLHGASGV